MPATAHQIRAAFDSLLSRDYVLAAESDAGMAGTIAYRSPHLWLSFEWDRSDPWLTITFKDVGPNPVMWTEVDRVFGGKAHPEYDPNTLPEAPVPRLLAFVQAVLPALEARLQERDSLTLNAARDLEGAQRRTLAELRAARRFR